MTDARVVLTDDGTEAVLGIFRFPQLPTVADSITIGGKTYQINEINYQPVPIADAIFQEAGGETDAAGVVAIHISEPDEDC